MTLHKMIEMYLKYDNMHTNVIINAFSCINNHVNLYTNFMLSKLISLFTRAHTHVRTHMPIHTRTCTGMYTHAHAHACIHTQHGDTFLSAPCHLSCQDAIKKIYFKEFSLNKSILNTKKFKKIQKNP